MLEIVRALVKAFEEKGRPLTRELFKALGMPYPEAPKPKKIPVLSTDAQARVLDYLNAYEDARIQTWSDWGGYTHHYELERSNGSRSVRVAPGTFEKLLKFKWIVYERSDTGYKAPSYFKLTDAGREVLTRYQVKVGAVPAC
jgi:hypothetical protein